MNDFFVNYPYAVFLSYFLVVWLIIFFCAAKTDKKEMLHMSSAGFFAGALVGPVYTLDWWSPQLVYSFSIPFSTMAFGVEDLLFGFTIFGIASVAYELMFRKKERVKNVDSLIKRSLFTFAVFMVAMVVFALSFALFGLHSLTATLVGCLVVLAYVFWGRYDLILPTIIAAVILSVIALPGYLFALYFNPEWISSDWMHHNLSGFQFVGIPVEEFIWYILVGLVASCIWERSRGVEFQ